MCVRVVVHACATIQTCGFLYLQDGRGLGVLCGILDVLGALPKNGWMVEFFGDHFVVPTETAAHLVPLFLDFLLLGVKR